MDLLSVSGAAFCILVISLILPSLCQLSVLISTFISNQKCLSCQIVTILLRKNAGEWPHPCNKYHYSFAEMRPYLSQTVRIQETWIYIAEGFIYNPEHMESIAYLWCDQEMRIWKVGYNDCIIANDIQFILDSPTILQCRLLYMRNAHFSFKDYKLLYNAKIIENYYFSEETDPEYFQFLEQPGVKPLVVLRYLRPESVNNLLDHLSKAFSSAVSPNAFKIVFAQNYEHLTEFRKTNNASGEKLELKKGLPTGYQNEDLDGCLHYTLERCSI